MTDTQDSPHAAAPGEVVAVGDTLAGRFRLDRFLAEGGMGAVYQAHDLVLGEAVAVKMLHGGIETDAVALARFRREIKLAHRVSHRNVCRVFDVFEHTLPEGKLPFLTMELVDGETVRERVRRDGPLTAEAALPIALQLCAALDAAHQAGVIHRDFKSQNVILAGDRVVVTDFGLARAPHEGDGSVTEEGAVLGTPAYMAPEQVGGEEATAASDIYALGIVLYELVTGRLPFEGKTPQSIATRRLTTPPVSPRKHRPGLPARWEQTLLRCLARDPAGRFSSAGEVARALRGEIAARRRWWLPLAAVVLALGAAIWTGTTRTPAATRRTVAVLGLRNVSADADVAWLSTAAAETLEAQLGDGKVRTVPGEEVVRARRDLGLTEVDALGAETLERLSERLGADVVVTGSYLAHGGEIRFQLRLQRTADGESIGAPIVEKGGEKEVLAVLDRAAARVRERLGLDEASGGSGLPRHPEAARLYAEGLERLRAFDLPAARERLQRALDVEPGAPLVHLALADAWESSQDRNQAILELDRARVAATELPPAQRTFIEARWRMLRSDPGAIPLLAELHAAHPDEPDYLVALLQAMITAGRLEQASTLLGAARARPHGPYAAIIYDDVEIVLLQAQYKVDSPEVLGEATVRAARRCLAHGARNRAAELLARAGGTFTWIDIPRAEALFAEARALAQEDPEPRLLHLIDYMAGGLANRLGRYREADRLAREQLARSRATGNLEDEMIELHNYALYRLLLGHATEAELLVREAMERVARPGHTKQVPVATQRIWQLALLANVRTTLGDLASVRQLLEESDRLIEESKTSGLRFPWRTRLSRLLLLEDRLDEARAVILPLVTRPDDFGPWHRLAQIELAAGRPAEAAIFARRAADAEPPAAFRRLAAPLAVLLEARLAQGDLDAARAVAAELTPIVPAVDEILARDLATIALAKFRAQAGDRAGARAALAEVILAARARGDVPIELDARLADARLAGPAALRALASDARARGFLLHARLASAR